MRDSNEMDEIDRQTKTDDMETRSKRLLVIAVCLVLSLAVFCVYAQVAKYGFVNFDDRDYVSENLKVRKGLSWQGTRWAFTAFHAGHYHPLTWVSHMLDCELFGSDQEAAGWHHLINVALHAVNSSLLFVILWRMTRQFWPCLLVAALFALHPLRVESVAWITGRKDVLSGLFFMLTLLAYHGFVLKRSAVRYALVIVTFALGLLAKPILITLPIVLLLLDFWPLGRMRSEASPSEHEVENPPNTMEVFTKVDPSRVLGLLIEKVPLLILALMSALVTFLAQRAAGAVGDLQNISLAWRLVNTPIGYVMYLVKSCWPSNLAIFYPHPATVPSQDFGAWLLRGIGAVILLALITVAVYRVRQQRPFLAMGWLWFLVMLVPMIGLVQVGMQSWADRFGYLPLIGVYVMVAWFLKGFVATLPNMRIVVCATLACVVIAMAWTTRAQVAVWQDSRTLFKNAITSTNHNFVAHTSLGNSLLETGRMTEAITHYRKALRIQPDYAESHNNLGLVLYGIRQLDQSETHLQKAYHLKPDNVDYRINLATVLVDLGRADEAIEHYQEAASRHPQDAAIYNNWGRALAIQGQFDEAVERFQKALSLDPNYAAARQNLQYVESQLQSGGGLSKPIQKNR